MYAFDSITSGKTLSVPWVGAVSLMASQPWNVLNTVAYGEDNLIEVARRSNDYTLG
jgi:hypothetical protein